MRIHLRTIVIDCPDAAVLSDFYAKLLGWEKTVVEPEWVLMRDPKGGTGLSFQAEADYRPPTWPEAEGQPPDKMLHLDFVVEDLQGTVQHAVDCGATIAPEQFYEDVVVLFDPAGHPFCLFTDPTFRWE